HPISRAGRVYRYLSVNNLSVEETVIVQIIDSFTTDVVQKRPQVYRPVVVDVDGFKA
ncbi:MAG: hypothetical protein GWN58_07615, partial [Anaerolineae bacterium]|nr:hypothetical protein [Anaerolineae bacterium]